METARHSDMFVRACFDTRTAWERTKLSRFLKDMRVDEVKLALANCNAKQLAELFMKISYSPYGQTAVSMGMDDKKAGRLSAHLMTAIFHPFVLERDRAKACGTPDAAIDLQAVKKAILSWIDTGVFGEALDGDASDLAKITKLLGSHEPRVALSAPFASPIEFTILAMSSESVGQGDGSAGGVRDVPAH